MTLQDNYKTWRPLVQSFQYLCDTQYRITYESLFERLSVNIGEFGAVKVCERLFDIISKGYPINLYKYAHFIYEFHNTESKLLFKIMDFNGDANVG